MNTARLISILSGLVLLVALAWSYGFLVGKGRLWPAMAADQAIAMTKSLIKFGAILPQNLRVKAPEGAARERAVIHEAEAAMGKGYYAITGWDQEVGNYKVWLYDAAGGILHSWNVDQTNFFAGVDNASNSPHALEVMRNGDIIVGFDWLGVMARLTTCSELVWLRKGYYHHAFTKAPDGNIWTWYSRDVSTGQYQYMLKFDPETGQTLKKIGLIEDIVTRSPATAALFSLRKDTKFEQNGLKAEDIFHPNDIEELTPSMAPHFPMFKAGDLLISLRNLNMVAVIDQAGTIKWMQQGPWRFQHDPDFRSDGTISIYNNSRGPGRTRSDIVLIDPKTRESRSFFGEWNIPFYSEYRGKQQELPNSNLLITIPEQGQALEVTPNGKVAVEFNNVVKSNSAFNDDLTNAIWLPEGYFNTLPRCS